MFRKFSKFFLFLLFLQIISGCAQMKLPSTKNLPYTKLEPLNSELNKLDKSKPILIANFNADIAEVEVKHHEGILQVEQPTYFGGPSNEQKKKIAVLAAAQVRDGFIEELKKFGFNVFDYLETACFYDIQGKVSKITIKTYGRGYGGVGSAGDYWESYTSLTDITVFDSCENKKQHIGNIDAYAKVKDSPVKLKGSVLEGILLGIEIIKNPLKGLMPDYELEDTLQSPMYLTGRIAAQKLIMKLNGIEINSVNLAEKQK